MGSSKKKKKKKDQKKKRDINIPFLIISVLFILTSFIDTSTHVETQDIKRLELTLTTDIKTIKGRNNDNSYRFWAKEYATQFVIENGIHPFKGSAQERFTKDSKIEVSIPKYYDLTDKLEETPVYSLSRNGKDYLTLKEYNIYSKSYTSRLRFFSISGGIFMLLIALSLIKRKQAIIAAVLFALSVLIMLIFKIGIYS